MRTLTIGVIAFSLCGCAYYMTPRPPVTERKLGSFGAESVGALATSADYRVVYVQMQPNARMCMEPPPDVAGQSAAAFAGAISRQLAEKSIDVNTQYAMAVSMKQLFPRSQGIQLYRDAATSACGWYLNSNTRDETAYLNELKAARETAAKLIEMEIQYMHKMAFDPAPAPNIQPQKRQTDESATGKEGSTGSNPSAATPSK